MKRQCFFLQKQCITYNCKIFKYSPKKTVVLKQCLINLKTGPL